jgi:hypothetical protein
MLESSPRKGAVEPSLPTLLVKFRLLLRKRMDMDGKFMNTKSKLSEIISQML